MVRLRSEAFYGGGSPYRGQIEAAERVFEAEARFRSGKTTQLHILKQLEDGPPFALVFELSEHYARIAAELIDEIDQTSRPKLVEALAPASANEILKEANKEQWTRGDHFQYFIERRMETRDLELQDAKATLRAALPEGDDGDELMKRIEWYFITKVGEQVSHHVREVLAGFAGEDGLSVDTGEGGLPKWLDKLRNNRPPRYRGRQLDGKAVEYFQFHYGEYVQRGGLTRKMLEFLDPDLLKALKGSVANRGISILTLLPNNHYERDKNLSDIF